MRGAIGWALMALALANLPSCSGGDHCLGGRAKEERWKDGCHACVCNADSSITCQPDSCEVSCEHQGESYQPGQVFGAGDGCNVCSCESSGEVLCSAAACGLNCNPATEWWASYAATDAAECAAIDFDCPGNTSAFENACGCGCAQTADCAAQYDCRMPNPCDIAELEADCPYSEIIRD